MSWVHPRSGCYKRTEGQIDALVLQDGEIWRSHVYVAGELVDQGEWDGRGVALRNARGAMRRARSLRAHELVTKDFDEEDDDGCGEDHDDAD